jgi:hypothetical protein
VILPALYHWSPEERRKEIRANGLRPYARTRFLEGETKGLGFPYICLSPSPSLAWSLSGDLSHETEYEDWDLWQVRLSRDDEVEVRAEFGDEIKEVRVRNAISGDRVWYVATRTLPFAEPADV